MICERVEGFVYSSTWQIISQLRSVACHVGLRSDDIAVTCHR